MAGSLVTISFGDSPSTLPCSSTTRWQGQQRRSRSTGGRLELKEHLHDCKGSLALDIGMIDIEPVTPIPDGDIGILRPLLLGVNLQGKLFLDLLFCLRGQDNDPIIQFIIGWNIDTT